MGQPPKILVIPGSTRTDSFNKKLAAIAAAAARAAGADVTLIDLRDFPLPLYDADLEAKEGLPEHARRLKGLLAVHPGLVFAAPEYNGSITGVLKNAIDWASRSAPGEAALASFADKTAAILSASPGALGGMRGLVTLRSILNVINVLVIPEQLSVSKAGDAFTPEGALKDPKQQAGVEKIVRKLCSLVGKLHDAPAKS